MKAIKTLLCLTLLLALPALPAQDLKSAKTRVEEALRQSDYTFTPAVRQAYIHYTEAAIREKYGPKTINNLTWQWVKKHPQVLSAIAAAHYPVNPTILLNFQRAALALGAPRTEKWLQLVLAYAIRYRDQPFPVDRVTEAWDPQRLERLVYNNTKGKGGDFALLSEEDFPQDVPEPEKALAEWLVGPQSLVNVRPPFTIPELMDMPLSDINAITRRYAGDEKLLQPVLPNWERVALYGRLYPPYVDGTPTPQRAILMKIYRNARIPGKTNRPDFKMEKSDWPILLYLTDLDHIDETSFVFAYFVQEKKIPPTGLGQVKSSSGSTDMDINDPNFRFARSNWNPNKFIRIYNGSQKDQGGKSQRWINNALNVPSTVVSAPPDGEFYYMGERGNYTYYLTCADNAFTGTGSSAPWFLDHIASVNAEVPFSGAVEHIHFIGLAATLNQGLNLYEDARIGLAVLNLINPGKLRRLSLLESLFEQNPLNQDIFYALASEYRSSADTDATLRLLLAARVYAEQGLKTPLSPSHAKNMRPTINKILTGKLQTKPPHIPVDTGTRAWFFLMCSNVAMQYLRDTNGKDKSRFVEELNYQRQCVGSNTDKPLLRALEDFQKLVN